MTTGRRAKKSHQGIDRRTVHIPLMNNSRLCDFIADPHQKIYYVFDLLGNWTFHIELIKIVPQADPLASLPSV